MRNDRILRPKGGIEDNKVRDDLFAKLLKCTKKDNMPYQLMINKNRHKEI